MSISHWKVGRAPWRPNRRSLYCQCPEDVKKAVFGLASGVRDTCRYPFAKSRVEMKCAFLRQSTKSSTQGRGSLHIQRLLSGVGTATMELDQELTDSSIILCHSIWLISSSTTCQQPSGTQYGHCLMTTRGWCLDVIEYQVVSP